MRSSSLCTLAVVLVAFLLSGCYSQLKTSQSAESGYLRSLRLEYLAANPNGEFNERVTNGEVVRGMDIISVLASWGHPQRRERHADLSEVWVYLEVEEATRNAYEFTFNFEGGILEDWIIHRKMSEGAYRPATSKTDVLSRTEVRSGKQVPQD